MLIGSRDLPKAQEIALQLGLDSSSGMLNIDAAKTCELACLTVPFAHQESTLISVDDGLQNKIMIDATVPLMPPKVMRVQLPEIGSAALNAQSILGDKTSPFNSRTLKYLKRSHEDCSKYARRGKDTTSAGLWRTHYGKQGEALGVTVGADALPIGPQREQK